MVVIQINNKKHLYGDFSTWAEHNDKCKLNRKGIERNMPKQAESRFGFPRYSFGESPPAEFSFSFRCK